MSSRKGRPVRPSMRGRTPMRRSRSWEDPGMDLEGGGRHTKLKNCCRSVATFMCTQVGVGGIIVGYAIVGAFGFMALETQDDSVADTVLLGVRVARNRTAGMLYTDYTNYQFNETEWRLKADGTLHDFQNQVVEAVKKGYDGRSAKEQWNFPAALMFTLSIFTMIGYGNLVPRTEWGKVITIFYAVFGIPLYILYFMNMGKALASIFKWLYIKLNSCSLAPDDQSESANASTLSPAGKTAVPAGIVRGGSGGSRHHHHHHAIVEEEEETVIVPSSASIYVLFSYICVGTIMFAEWEGWEYLDSVYFCVTSLCKIGLGDFVPGELLQPKVPLIRSLHYNWSSILYIMVLILNLMNDFESFS